MDPLSISASIAGLLTISDLIVRKGFKFCSELKDADETVKSLFSEVNLLVGTLSSLRNVADRFEGDGTPNEYAMRVDHIDACHATLDKIHHHLEKVTIKHASPDHPGIKKDGALTRAKRRMLWPLSRTETMSLLADVERHKSAMNLALNVDSTLALLQALASQEVMSVGINDIASELKVQKRERADAVIDEKRNKVFQSLTVVDYKSYQESNLRLRHPGTGTWFLDGDVFKEWVQIIFSDAAELMDCVAGAGKTVLTSSIIQQAQQISRSSLGTAALAFYFCDYKNPSSHDILTILGSLVKQLANQSKQGYSDLEKAHTAHINEDKTVTPYDKEDLCNLIETISTRFVKVMIIIDGLDEISTARSVAVETLCNLSTKSKNMKLLFTSRDEVDIREHLVDFSHVSIAAESRDLRLYVAAEIERRTSRKELWINDPDLKEHIMKTLIAGAEGMFRWVACQMDYLCELNNDNDRRAALQQLPPTLESTYERILARVSASNKGNQMLVQRVMHWMIGSNQGAQIPFRFLVQAVAIKDGEKKLNPNALSTEYDILKWCSSLIRRVSPDSDKVELAHFTVKEFFMGIESGNASLSQYAFDSASANRNMAATCLTILNFDEFDTHPPKIVGRIDDYMALFASERPLYTYACLNWDNHAVEFSDDEYIRKASFELFKPSKCNQFLWWKQVYLGELYDGRSFKGTLPTFPDSSTLNWAAHMGVPWLCEDLLEAGCDVNQPSPIGTPLISAFGCNSDLFKQSRGKVKKYAPHFYVDLEDPYRVLTVNAILDAEPNVTGVQSTNFNLSPLAYALMASDGFGDTEEILDIMTILLNAGARIVKNDLCYVNEHVLEDRDSPVTKEMQMLLDPEWQDLVDDDANETLALWKSLIEIRSNENEINVFQEELKPLLPEVQTLVINDLHDACRYGQLDEVKNYQRRLKFGVDEAIYDEALLKALRCAIRYPHINVVKFLLEAGIDPKSLDATGNSPLHHACSCDSPNTNELVEIITLLMEHEVDLSVANNQGITPLHLAATRQSMDIVRLFEKSLKNGEDIKKQAKSGKTPIWCAIEDGSDETAEYLIAFCPDGLLQSLSYEKQSCLAPACSRPTAKILELLLARGVDPETTMEDGSFAIHHAASVKGSEEAFKLLLNRGVSHSVQDKANEAPIHILCRLVDDDSHDKLDALLLAGGNPNQLSGSGLAPLHYLLNGTRFQNIHVEMLERLLQHEETDVNIKNKEGLTTLLLCANFPRYFTSAYSERSRLKAIELLIEVNCDLTMTDKDDRTALHLMCDSYPVPDVLSGIKLLIEKGLALDREDAQNVTPFELAMTSIKFITPPPPPPPSKELQKGPRGPPPIPAPSKHSAVEEYLDAGFGLDYSDDDVSENSDSDGDSVTYEDPGRHKSLNWEWSERIKFFFNTMEKEKLEQPMSNGRYPISYMLEYAPYSVTTRLLDLDIEINVVDKDLEALTPLEAAAKWGCDNEIARLLVAKTARCIDEFNRAHIDNPLHLCCRQSFRSMPLLRQLIKGGASLELPNAHGDTPLMIASESGSAAPLTLLLRNSVAVNTRRFGSGPMALHLATQGGHDTCVSLLVDKGADLEGQGIGQLTPIQVASSHHRWSTFEILLQAGASMSLELFNGTSLLHQAAAVGAEDILKLIFDKSPGVNLDLKDGKGSSPVLFAASSGSERCVRFLLDRGASLFGVSSFGNIAHFAMNPGTNSVRNMLLETDVDWEYNGGQGYLGTYLVAGMTPFHLACHLGIVSAMEFLHSHNLITDINELSGEGMTALHLAARTRLASTQRILTMGADINALDARFRRTPLHFAASVGLIDNVRILLSYGCDSEILDINHCTAEVLALQGKHTEAVQILRQHRARKFGAKPDRERPETPEPSPGFKDRKYLGPPRIKIDRARGRDSSSDSEFERDRSRSKGKSKLRARGNDRDLDIRVVREGNGWSYRPAVGTVVSIATFGIALFIAFWLQELRADLKEFKAVRSGVYT